MPPPLTILGTTNARNTFTRFGIKQNDRFSHSYIIGKTGVGKTVLLENLIRQDMEMGRGCTVLDPHGDMVERLNLWAMGNPLIEPAQLIYLNAPDNTQPYGYNPLRRVSPNLRPLLASGMLEVFKKLWSEAWGVRMEHIFRNVLHTLLDQPESTLADIPRILSDKNFRTQAQRHITSPYVRDFWAKEFSKYSLRYRADAIAPILNKVGGFLAHPTLSRILTEPKQNLSLRKIMDDKQILLVNLAKGKLGEDASQLLGGLLMTSLGLAAFSRADQPENQRIPHHLFADEFQNFSTLSIVNMASELRKYALSLTLANQYLSQLKPDILSAVLGNVGSLISFRVGAEDSYTLAKQFAPAITESDLQNLPNHNIYLKLMIDGTPSKPFSAITLPSTLHHYH